MTRRREKVNYPIHQVDRGIKVVMAEGSSEPKLNRKQISIVKKLSRLAFRLVSARTAKNDAAARETKIKKDIEELLDEISGAGVIGLIRLAGPETSTELKRVEVTGREVADAITMLSYLGHHSASVVKSVQLPFALMAQDPQKFNQALSYLVGLYGPELSSGISLDLNVGKLDTLQKNGELGDEPEGLWRFKRQGYRIDAKLLSAE